MLLAASAAVVYCIITAGGASWLPGFAATAPPAQCSRRAPRLRHSRGVTRRLQCMGVGSRFVSLRSGPSTSAARPASARYTAAHRRTPQRRTHAIMHTHTHIQTQIPSQRCQIHADTASLLDSSQPFGAAKPSETPRQFCSGRCGSDAVCRHHTHTE